MGPLPSKQKSLVEFDQAFLKGGVWKNQLTYFATYLLMLSSLVFLPKKAIHLRRDTDGYDYSIVTQFYAELTRQNTRRDTDGYDYSIVTQFYAGLTRQNTGCSFETATIAVSA